MEQGGGNLAAAQRGNAVACKKARGGSASASHLVAGALDVAADVVGQLLQLAVRLCRRLSGKRATG